jgi:molybdate transport system substrate-binding protein
MRLSKVFFKTLGSQITFTMKTHTLVLKLLITAILMFATGQSIAGEIRVAVASNFAIAITTISERFEVNTGHKVTLVFGSTGMHYTQIKNGAPFDAFFAADAKRPKLLEDEGVALPDSRFTYAVGKVVLWSPKANYVDPAGEVLEQGDFRHLALANPKLAPYGQAARVILEKRGRWQVLQDRMVRGENIGQTFQFVKSGNAELGFVAWSQIKRPGQPMAGSWWEIPQALYSPIEQQAILLKDNSVARDFLTFVRGKEALKIIGAYGYGMP